MLRIAIAILVVVGIAAADRVSFTPLNNNPNGASINWVEIIGCNTTRCQVKRGEYVRLRSEFVTASPYQSLHGKVSTTFLGIPYTLPLEESNVCKLGVDCPIEAGTAYIVNESVLLSAAYPSVTVDVRFELLDDSLKLAVGFTTKITII